MKVLSAFADQRGTQLMPTKLPQKAFQFNCFLLLVLNSQFVALLLTRLEKVGADKKLERILTRKGGVPMVFSQE